MADVKNQEMKKWVSAWQKAALSLKGIKKNELRAPDYYEKNRKMLDEMLQYACDNVKVRSFSGLVEQQRFFMKFKRDRSVIKKA